MTSRQFYLIEQIKRQRQILAEFPGDLVEETNLDALITELRSTFCVVSTNPTPQYVYSESRAVLKRIQ